MSYYIFSIMYMAIFGYLGHKAKISKKLNLIFMILSAIVVNIPFNGMSVNILTYSFLGEMSIFLFTFCLLSIFENLKLKSHRFLDIKSFIFIFIFGLILYLTSLNIVPINIYYGSNYLVILLCCLIGIGAFFINQALGIIYLICLISYGIEIMYSKNLFDYFIDVPTWIFSILSIIYFSVSKIQIKYQK